MQRSSASEESGPTPPKTIADLPLPALEVPAQDRWLVVVGDLGRAERLLAAAEQQAALAAGAEVADPLGVAAGGDQVALTARGEQVDRTAAPLAAAAPAHLEHARAGQADARPRQPGDHAVENVAPEPARLLVVGLLAHRRYV
jgi:hypothetical protein